MEILILTPNGETVKMPMWKTESVIDLKKRISEKLFMAPEELQRILFNGHVLDDENSVEQFAIEDKSVITLVEGLRGSGITIFATTIDGRSIEIEIDPIETVLTLKKKIDEKLTIDPDSQKLVFKGEMLNVDENKLKDYPITDGSVINVVERRRGGLLVFIKSLSGNCATECMGKHSVLDLKRKIWEKLSIPPDLQELNVQGVILDDESKIADYPFCSQSVINLIVAASRQILVRTSDGGTFKQEMGGARTVRDLKKRIGRKLSLTIEELNMAFQDIILEEDTMIDKLNILEDSFISVHIQKRICFEKDGEKIFLPVGMEETISDIKRRICEKADSSSDDIQLCYKAGRRLRDDKTLLDYKIEDTAQIRVLFL